MSEIHAMVDLETMSTLTNAAVAQCGIVCFEADSIPDSVVGGSGQEWNINLASSLLHGGEVDKGAVKFWRDRPAQWDALTQGARTIPFLLDTLDAYWREFSPVRVWCHGATFDVPILQGYYERLGRRTPWEYGQVRDTRTLFELAAQLTGWERPRYETVHLGLADALAQAREVQEAMAVLRTTHAVGTSVYRA